MSRYFEAIADAIGDGVDRVDGNALAVAGGVTAASALVWYLFRKSSKPSFTQLGGGSLDSGKIQTEVADYYAEFSSLKRGDGAVMAGRRKERVAELVDTFYSLVTDIYEWGWGTSFHFSPVLPGAGWPACEAAHEARIAALTRLAPGKAALDVGCGVGGPMRMVAAVSGGAVTGITINEYQVQRARHHNERAGLAAQCTPVRGNFMEMPFADASFDAAYAIEATCHASTLEAVYTEIFRCLKPGSIFVAYEWVSTPKYDAKDRRHVAIMDEIIIGNGLPDMRTWAQAEAAGTAVGFELLESRDLAILPGGGLTPWWRRLGWSLAGMKRLARVNHALVTVAETLRVVPKGMIAVHTMLMDTGIAIYEGGELGIFTPMHMLVLRKPE